MISLALLRVIAILVLVAANAFFVAAEFALVSVRDTRLQQLIEAVRVGARAVQRLHRNLDQFLSAVQFGVTLTSLGLGWVGEMGLADLLIPSFRNLPHGVVYAHALASAMAFASVTYLHVTRGEVVPKSVALHRAERVALAVAAPMEVFMTISRPALFVFSRTARAVLRLFGTRPVREAGVHSPEELKLIATSSRRVGLLHPLEEEMIHRALELGEVTVREIMVPRHSIFSLPSDMTLNDALARLVEEQHSRVPVYDPQRGPEHIVGVLYSKDLMCWTRLRLLNAAPSAVQRISQAKIGQVMHDVLVVPETKSLLDLLGEFQQRQRNM